jgi:PAS domain S-box-containing protein
LSFVNRYRCKDGSYRWLEWSSYPSGATIYAVARDITQRRTAIEALKESEERFYQALENIPDVVVIYDRDLRIRFINEATRKVTGLPTSHFMGKRDDEVWPPEVYQAYLPALELAFASGKVQEVDSEIVLAEGNVRQLHITCVPILDDKSDVREVVGITHDYTEQRLMERSLRQAQKMEAVGQLTSGIAHDFNNALTAISVNVGLLDILVKGDSKTSKHIEEINKSVKRSAILTRKLLNFSRTDMEGAKRVSANEFVQGMHGLITKSLTPAINVEVVLAPDSWLVEIDPGDLEDALLNLALNARDAMPDGGTLVIETANKVLDRSYVQMNPGSTAGEFVMMTVSDTGTGMPKDVAEKAFDPFFTTKDVGKGTGLGLSMVYAFVQRSGGHVKIYSEPDNGTTIHLYFPRVLGAEEDLTEVVIDPSQLPRGSETVLIVDDEEDLLDAAVSILEGQGYRALTTASGIEALALVKEDPSIDLLFSDVVMPGKMDGYRLAIEALKFRPDLRVLLTSGFTRKREEFVNGQGEIVAKLAKSILHKPYSIEELAIAVRRSLDGEPLLGD